ncbi:type II toxin-antitoxin system RelE/ParE family toxin [Patescibacteria group bacterium]|nr:type II toxin-antitoxin system RelE/ParE family toxin [Patescibacteria group bacterium]
MIGEIILQPTAIKDIREIFIYLSEQTYSEEFAEKYVEKIIGQIEILSFFPGIGRSVNIGELISEKLRCLILGEYAIYYERDKQKIEIIHIWHSRKIPLGFDE